jgi:hypothetical protein
MKTILIITLTVLAISCKKAEPQIKYSLEKSWELVLTQLFVNDSLQAEHFAETESIFYHFQGDTLEILEEGQIQLYAYYYDESTMTINTSTSLSFVVDRLTNNELWLSTKWLSNRTVYIFRS